MAALTEKGFQRPLYEELLAFKRACKTLGLTKQDVEDIMYNNAHDLIEGARKSIYG